MAPVASSGKTLLGIVALVTLGAALLHGPALAALGLVGAEVTPLLAASDTPDYWALYIYLAIVTAAAFAMASLRLWRWLAITALAFGLFWALPGVADAGTLAPHRQTRLQWVIHVDRLRLIRRTILTDFAIMRILAGFQRGMPQVELVAPMIIRRVSCVTRAATGLAADSISCYDPRPSRWGAPKLSIECRPSRLVPQAASLVLKGDRVC